MFILEMAANINRGDIKVRFSGVFISEIINIYNT